MLKLLLFVLFFCSLEATESAKAISEANRENKHLFIFFFKDQNEKTKKIQCVFDQFITNMGPKVRSIKIKSTDYLEADIVSKYKLKDAPMPFVLVMAPNGAITGGFSSFSEKDLLESIVSSGAARTLKALQDQKLCFICLQGGQTQNNLAALQGVFEFTKDPLFAHQTTVITIDPQDPNEYKFITTLGLDPKTKEAVTLFLSPTKAINSYSGETDKAQFMSDLYKAVPNFGKKVPTPY